MLGNVNVTLLSKQAKYGPRAAVGVCFGGGVWEPLVSQGSNKSSPGHVAALTHLVQILSLLCSVPPFPEPALGPALAPVAGLGRTVRICHQRCA